MAIYINGSACISHFNTLDENFFFEDVSPVPTSNQLQATEPDYKEYIQPVNLLRRMSHVVKMGVSAALQSIKNSNTEKVEAIVIGTGIGCYEDTDKFLRSLIENNEELLTPTSFIQSTHNTVAGQIALMIKCYGYNFTYVHQNLSFEYALLDAMMLLNDKEENNIIVGGIDETTHSLLELFTRAGHVKKNEELEPVWTAKNKGYVLGEGASIFNLSSIKSVGNRVEINGIKCLQQVYDSSELMKETIAFLSEQKIDITDIDLILSGNCGDALMDKKIANFNNEINLPIGYFKNLCGEYFTSSGFAVWLATKIVEKQSVPQTILPNKIEFKKLKRILIVNHYHDKEYSLICISAC
jgi:3-oxoacyl-[acyl-carrier-protein] synthase II